MVFIVFLNVLGQIPLWLCEMNNLVICENETNVLEETL